MLGEGKEFSSPDEAVMAYKNGHVSIKAAVKVQVDMA